MPHVTISMDGHVAVVTLDRPPVNAVDHATLRELHDAFAGLGDDRQVRAAVFAATGERAWIAGADLKAIPTATASDLPTREVTDPGLAAREAFWAIYDCAVPVIAAVTGPALGAGMAFAAVCDVIIAAQGATFAAPEINVGLLGASAHLAMLVGRHKARELYFTGDPISAEELHRLGAVREVLPRSEVLPAAKAFAARIAEKSPVAMRLAKEAMSRAEFLSLKEAYRVEQDYTRRLQGYGDAAEARQAFAEKRTPKWTWT